MRVPIAATALVATLALAAGRGGAFLENRAWAASSVEKLSISRLGSVIENHAGITMSVDGSLGWAFDHPDAGLYDGTATEKGSRRFFVTPSPASVAAYRAYLQDEIEVELGADEVLIETMRLSIKGKVDPEGLLRMKIKVVARGTATLDSVTKKGVARVKARVTGSEL
jgi:hypothetical protein